MRIGRRIYAVLRFAVIWVPGFLFACALLFPWIPGSMGLFSDSAVPWYQSITAPLFLAALMYAYPLNFLCTRVVSDDMFLSPGYYVVLAIYTGLWIVVLRAIFAFFERRTGTAP